MHETMTQRALRKMLFPAYGLGKKAADQTPDDRPALLETLYEQANTIEIQRVHIAQLNERIAKMEREADGLRSLI